MADEKRRRGRPRKGEEKPKPEKIKAENTPRKRGRPVTSEKTRIKHIISAGGHIPPFNPTDDDRRLVEYLSGRGLPQDQIAALVRADTGGISLGTLHKYFRKDIILGKAKINQEVGGALYNKVMSGDTTAAIFWAKTQMRWAEVHKTEISGPDGGAISIATVDASKLSTATLKELLDARIVNQTQSDCVHVYDAE